MDCFTKLKCWNEAKDISLALFPILKPEPQYYSLHDQMRRAAISISSNIAEGWARKSDTQFAHFLDIAIGSSSELESQLLIYRELLVKSSDNPKITDAIVLDAIPEILQKCKLVRRLMIALKEKLRPKKA